MKGRIGLINEEYDCFRLIHAIDSIGSFPAHIIIYTYIRNLVGIYTVVCILKDNRVILRCEHVNYCMHGNKH